MAKMLLEIPKSLRKRGVLMADFAAATRQAQIEALVAWKDGTLDKHFLEGAPSAYKGAYRSRSPKYKKRKRGTYGHNRPMEFTGTFRKTITLRKGIISARASGGSKRATMKLPHARAANLWGGGGRKHDFHESITAMNKGELYKIARFVEKRVAELLKGGLSDIETVRA